MATLARCHSTRQFFQQSKDSFLLALSSVSQLLATDASARITMKDAAKCDKRREWQDSANRKNAERTLHFQVIPESMSGSELLASHVSNHAKLILCCLEYVFVRQRCDDSYT